MLLKRIYKTPEDWVKEVDEKGNCTNPPELDYITFAHTGVESRQNLSIEFVTDAIKQKWATLDGDTITLHLHPVDLKYTILCHPGRYCCHCGEKLGDDEKGALSRLHVAAEHPDEESPDPDNTSGYKRINYFECRLDKKQHEKYKVKGPALAPIFPLRSEG